MLNAVGNNLTNSNFNKCSNLNNQNYYISSSTTKPDEFVSQKKDDKKQISNKTLLKIAGGLLAFGGIVATAIFSKGKTLKPANFAEHIDFKPAETMEGAINFAKNNFGIKRFEFDNDLEFANWVNEGLTNINNRFKGKANFPEVFRFKTSEELAQKKSSAIAFCTWDCNNPQISFNKEYINNSIKEFKKLAEKCIHVHYENGNVFGGYHLGADRDVHNKILLLYKNLHETPSNVSRFDALNGIMLLDDYVQSLNYFNKNKLNILQNKILNNDKAIKILKENNLPTTLNEYKKLSDEQLQKRMENMLQLLLEDVPIMGTATVRGNGKFGVLYHEMGHYLHRMNTSLKDSTWGRLSNKSQKAFTNSFEKQEVAGKVSWYAQTSPKEFVAECFSALCSGKKLPDDVMDIYKYYKGPIFLDM